MKQPIKAQMKEAQKQATDNRQKQERKKAAPDRNGR